MNVFSGEIPTYRPVTAYGMIGNCRTAALIAPDGSLDWGCFPDFDSPALFCRLLDAHKGGYFQIAPTQLTNQGLQRYLPDSNVLQTTFTNPQGTVTLTDCMPTRIADVMLSRRQEDSVYPLHQNGLCCVIRRVECLEGDVALTLTLKVTPGYDASPCTITLLSDQGRAVISGPQQHAGLVIVQTGSPVSIALRAVKAGEAMHSYVIAQMTLRQGERLVCVLGIVPTLEAAINWVEVDSAKQNFEFQLADTLAHWRTWLQACAYRGPYAPWVRRSALTLKMLTHTPTGEVIGAPTTSLPEHLGGGRNWDYRCTWQ